MPRRNVVLVVLLIAVATLVGNIACQQYMAKHGGGTMTVQLAPGQRLVTVTWKDSELWYLTRPRTPEEKPIPWTFKEKSNLGIQEGTVLLVEN